MCDLPEEEQAELELWAEYVRARATAWANRPRADTAPVAPPEAECEPAAA